LLFGGATHRQTTKKHSNKPLYWAVECELFWVWHANSPIVTIIFVYVLCVGFDIGRVMHLNIKKQFNVPKTALFNINP
jgi:hypothetical protein